MKTDVIVRASDVMNKNVVTVRAGTALREAARILEEEKVHGAPVVDAAKNIVGVVSGTDLAAALTSDVDPNEPTDRGVDFLEAEGEPLVSADPDDTVENVMSTRVVEASPELTVGALARLMKMEEVHRVLITEGKTLHGIVSVTDLLECITKYEKALET